MKRMMMITMPDDDKKPDRRPSKGNPGDFTLSVRRRGEVAISSSSSSSSSSLSRLSPL